jgi:uncharacterized membrane protein (UPF0127 family)
MKTWTFSADEGPAWHGLILDRSLARMRGWLFRDPSPECEALLLPRCNAVHMFGVARPLALLFLKFDGTVIDFTHAAPWSLPRIRLGAWGVLEIAASQVPPDWQPKRITWKET